MFFCLPRKFGYGKLHRQFNARRNLSALIKGTMKIIVVSGERSGIGKTHLAQELLKYLSGWSALKVTVGRDSGCPHERSCGVCLEIKEPFYIIKEPRIINQAGKDTARLKEAGAKEGMWLK